MASWIVLKITWKNLLQDGQINLGVGVTISFQTLSSHCSLPLEKKTKSLHSSMQIPRKPLGEWTPWHFHEFLDHNSLWNQGLRNHDPPLCTWHVGLLNQVLRALISSLNHTCNSVTCRKQNQREQFVLHLPARYLPVCHVANDHGANKKSSIYTWLKEVKLPGVLTHQVKLQGQVQLEEREYSTETMACQGWVMERNQCEKKWKENNNNKKSEKETI